MRRRSFSVALAALMGICCVPSAVAADPGADLNGWLARRGDGVVHRVADRIPALAAGLGVDRFGGTHWTENGALVVQVVGNSGRVEAWTDRRVEAWADGLDDDVAVRVEKVRFTRKHLKSVEADLRGEVAAQMGRPAVLAAWVDAPANRVRATVSPEDVEIVSALTARRYDGAVAIEVGHRPTLSATNRRQDRSPFYGALSINNSPTSNPGHPSDCTSGYAWRLWSNGQVVESTAGHCWARGTAVYNAQSRVGTVTHRAFATESATDAEFITPPSGTTFASRIWVGPTATTVSWPVVGALDETDAHVGGPLVISGSNGGATRGTVLDVNVRECFGKDGAPPCINGLTLFRVVSGGIQGGDSGGPCFSSASGRPSTAVARGQVVGATIKPGPGQLGWCTSVTDISRTLEASIITQ